MQKESQEKDYTLIQQIDENMALKNQNTELEKKHEDLIKKGQEKTPSQIPNQDKDGEEIKVDSNDITEQLTAEQEKNRRLTIENKRLHSEIDQSNQNLREEITSVEQYFEQL